MAQEADARLIVHLVGSLPLPDAATTFRVLSRSLGPYVARLPDGETGVRRSWIRFLQDVLAAHPAIDIAVDVPPFRFTQWDGKLIREIPRLRIVPGMTVDSDGFDTGYADMALRSWRAFESLKAASVIPSGIKFQVSLPTPIAPTYNNMVPADRAGVLPALTRHMIAEMRRIAAAIPPASLAVQWDVCQEVLAWEGYYEPGPVDFRSETLEVLAAVGDAVPPGVDLGYHLCYGSPADEHLVQPTDAGILADIVDAVCKRVSRPIQFFHIPVPKARSDDAYFAPLAHLSLPSATELYLGLIHFDDRPGDAARLAAARRHVRVDGIGTECGMARGDASRLASLLESHVAAMPAPSRN